MNALVCLSRKLRRGLTLLEVILAIAILGGSLAVIGELMRVGIRHAEESRDSAMAQILCEGKMEEIAAGVSTPDAVSDVPFDSDSRWKYSVTSGSANQSGLLQVQVTVTPNDPDRASPPSFTLIRWIMDPSVQQAASQAGTTGTTATSTTGTSTGGSNAK